MLTQAHEQPIRSNPIAQLAKDKMALSMGKVMG